MTSDAITYRPIYNRSRTVCIWHNDHDVTHEIAQAFREAGFVTSTVDTLETAVRSMQQNRADVLLVDIDRLLRDPQLIGILRVFSRGMRVFALTAAAPPPADVVRAVHAGALSVFAQPYRMTEILGEVIKELREDLRELPQQPEHGTKVTVTGFGSLTDREREVLDQVVEGHTNKEVALEMGISPRTVEVHRSAAMKKLGARNTAELVRIVVGSSRH